MGRYVIRRLLWAALGLFIVAFITFVLMHTVPGGPWDVMGAGKTLSPTVIENIKAKYGWDRPYLIQFGDYVWNAVRGDLGVAWSHQGKGVTEVILSGLPYTASLGITAFFLSILVGLPLGMAAALKQNSIVDYISVVFATIFASVPAFVLGIFLVVVFSLKLHWLPTGGLTSFRHLILPAFTLAALPAAYFARITRASVLDVVRQDYVRTARAKGLSERVVLVRHILRNAMIPVTTIAGPEFAGLITGSFIIENLFSIPGIGRLFVQGIGARDYGLIMGTVLFYAFIIAMANLLVDILYGAIDPRIRYD
jgi:oligopeptide transport system permease protein